VRRVAVPGEKLRVAEREGKKSTDERRSEHEKDYSNKLAARHRFSRLVPTHFVTCATACLFTSEHRNECSPKKPRGSGAVSPLRRFLRLCPRLPRVPILLKLRLGLLMSSLGFWSVTRPTRTPFGTIFVVRQPCGFRLHANQTISRWREVRSISMARGSIRRRPVSWASLLKPPSRPCIIGAWSIHRGSQSPGPSSVLRKQANGTLSGCAISR
jgi:hypothetical protein